MPPDLEEIVAILNDRFGADCLEDSFRNPMAKNLPTLIVKREGYKVVAAVLKTHPRLSFDYLSELHGNDFQTHKEIFVCLCSFSHGGLVAMKTKIPRNHPVVPSLTHLWPGAEWPECEAYDLLGIRFEGHPNLRRLFLGENWQGFPLRKDYVEQKGDIS